MPSVVSLVLGGGRGTRLSPLTGIRSKPAVPLAGKYRLIDIPISNCINSGINRIFVVTQFMSASLHQHIRRTYTFDQFTGGFVEMLAAQETPDAGADWYEGTADAVRKNLRYIRSLPESADLVLILSGDQLYRMDFREMIETHLQSKADVSIAAIPVTRNDAKSLGVMRVDDEGKVVGFLEKPQSDEEIDLVRMPPEWIDAHGVQSLGRDCLASMGIYLFNRETLFEVLDKTEYTDFGKEVFPAAIRARKVKVHLFDGYWEDIGTIRSFYEANLSLAGDHPPFDFSAPEAPVYTRARFLPPTRIADAKIHNSLLADGCRIGKGTVIENSVIGLRCNVGENVTIKNSIVMGADFFDTKEAEQGADHVSLGIGAGSLIKGAIVDKNCRIGDGVRIENSTCHEDFQSPDGAVIIRDGIPIVVKDSTLPEGWTLKP